MNLFDGIIIAVLILSAYLGARSGLLRELLGFSGWVIALVIALKFGGEVAELVRDRIPRIDAIAPALAFILLLAAVRLLVHIVLFLVRRMLKTDLLTRIDRILGSVVGFLKGALLLSVLALLIVILPLNQNIKDLEKNTVTLHHLSRFARWSVRTVEKIVPETRTVLDIARRTVQIDIDQEKIEDISTTLTPEELKKIYEKERKRAERLKEQMQR